MFFFWWMPSGLCWRIFFSTISLNNLRLFAVVWFSKMIREKVSIIITLQPKSNSPTFLLPPIDWFLPFFSVKICVKERNTINIASDKKAIIATGVSFFWWRLFVRKKNPIFIQDRNVIFIITAIEHINLSLTLFISYISVHVYW